MAANLHCMGNVSHVAIAVRELDAAESGAAVTTTAEVVQ